MDKSMKWLRDLSATALVIIGPLGGGWGEDAHARGGAVHVSGYKHSRMLRGICGQRHLRVVAWRPKLRLCGFSLRKSLRPTATRQAVAVNELRLDAARVSSEL